MKLSELTQHPENNNIYDATDLNDLKNSLSVNGQLEPIAITRDNKIISGHRRHAAMVALGWSECDVRFVEPENEIIALIEYNNHRQKTKGDLVREAEYLQKELRKTIGRGRNASSARKGKKQGQRLTTATELAQKLGVGTTQLKQLMSISNYEPKLITEIDKGQISVSEAYRVVQKKYIHQNRKLQPEVSGQDGLFRVAFQRLLKDFKPSTELLHSVIKNTYPYALSLTGIEQSRVDELQTHLEKLSRLDSYETMFVRKKDELDHLDVSRKELESAEGLLPSKDELNDFWSQRVNIFDVELIVADGTFTCEKTNLTFDNRLWETLRVCISSHEYFSGPGRKMNAFVGFNNENGFRLLGIFGFASDSHTLGVRDDHIGWTTDQRSRMREHLVNMNTCVPTQPFGFNRLGGKFIALYAEELIKEWEKKYKTKIVGITTTSLHGSQGQYNGMKWYKSLGTSSGSMLISPLRDEWSFWRYWFKENFPDEHEIASKRSSPKQAMLSHIFRLVGLNAKGLSHNHKRGVFFRPLYTNYREFLCEEVSETDLQHADGAWHDWYFTKVRKRIQDLVERKEVQSIPLFYDGIDEDVLEMWLSSRGVNG
ncbi:DUF4338 domain-containing protein [Luminiphilus sp.]|nr:DUF4338 domain-containing protein [Luminiphilus sp.]